MFYECLCCSGVAVAQNSLEACPRCGGADLLLGATEIDEVPHDLGTGVELPLDTDFSPPSSARYPSILHR